MRVTTIMREYIHKRVAEKVADKLAAAEKAANDQTKKDSAAIKAVKDYAESLIPDATKKVVAFAKKQGLTWCDHVPSWYGVDKDVNAAFEVMVNDSDFEETNPRDNNTSAARKSRKELNEEPARIRAAVKDAVNAIVFSIELGKVKKAELEELITSTEIEL